MRTAQRNRDSGLDYIMLAISMLLTLQLLITVGVGGTKIRTSTIYENSLDGLHDISS